MKIGGTADFPIFKILSSGASGSSIRNLQNQLTVGSRYEGTVLDIIPGKGALLDIAGQTVIAQTELPLAKGLNAGFEVREVHPQVVLRMVGETPAEGWQKEAFKQFLALRGETSGILNNITGRLVQILDSSPHMAARLGPLSSLWGKILVAEEPLPSVLKFIGLGWESRLKTCFLGERFSDLEILLETDLKGLVMQTLNSLSESESNQFLFRALSSLLNLIEGYQSANTLYPSQGAESIIFLPIWFSKQAGWGECELLLQREQDEVASPERSDGSSFRALFFLNMSRLGPMRISLQVSEKRINCIFMVSDEDKQKHVAGFLPELKERLVSEGFSVRSMECMRREEKEMEDVSTWFETLKKVRQPLLHVVI